MTASESVRGRDESSSTVASGVHLSNPVTSVLFIRQHLGPVGEGTSVRGWEQVTRLVRDGHAVTVITGVDLAPGQVPPGVRVRSTRTEYAQQMAFWRRKLAFLLFAVKATALATRSRYDVVFASSTPLLVFVPAIAAKALRPRTRLVLEVRDLWPAVPIAIGALSHPMERWLALRLERLSYRFADEVIALSPGMAEGIARVSRHNPVVVPNGALRSDFVTDEAEVQQLRAELGIPSHAPVVLYAGSVGLINDPDYLQMLFDHLLGDDDSVWVVLVGSGPGHEQLRHAFTAKERIIVRDRVERNRVRIYFAMASISLVTFIDDPVMESNSANKFFDSLAAGCPVAINYGGWHGELLEHSGAGISLSRAVADGTRQLSGLLADVGRLAAMADCAERLSVEFEWQPLYARWSGAVLGNRAREN